MQIIQGWNGNGTGRCDQPHDGRVDAGAATWRKLEKKVSQSIHVSAA
jgi:hypothetical protein